MKTEVKDEDFDDFPQQYLQSIKREEEEAGLEQGCKTEINTSPTLTDRRGSHVPLDIKVDEESAFRENGYSPKGDPQIIHAYKRSNTVEDVFPGAAAHAIHPQMNTGAKPHQSTASGESVQVLSKGEWLKQKKVQQQSYRCGGNLRNRPRVKYTEEDVPKDEDDLYCEDCESFYIDECGVHGPPNFVPDTHAPVGVPDRARLTLPPGLEIRTSNIPNAGLGVFNQDQHVPTGAHFGPYEGEVTDEDEAMESGYSWIVSRTSGMF